MDQESAAFCHVSGWRYRSEPIICMFCTVGPSHFAIASLNAHTAGCPDVVQHPLGPGDGEPLQESQIMKVEQSQCRRQ